MSFHLASLKRKDSSISVKLLYLYLKSCAERLVNYFLKLYDKTKRKLKVDMGKHRVCLTTDTWISCKKYNYMVVTAHFIDDEWKMHKRIINFCIISSHDGNSIGLMLENCLIHRGITKVLTITVDNTAANKCAIDFVKAKFNKRDNPENILKNKHIHMRCAAHTANLVVGSGLKVLNRVVLAIRNAVKFVRSSPSRLESFKACIVKCGIPCKGLVVMDVTTSWNSTFLMLEAALKFRAAFARLEEQKETGFAAYFKDPDKEFDEEGNLLRTLRRPRVGPRTDDEWEKAQVFVQFPKVFYNVTLRVSASNKPAIHTTLHDVMSMDLEIKRLLVELEMMDESETEKVLIDMASKMQEKFFKYYGGFHELNNLVIIGLVLDPRFKLRHITHLLEEEKHLAEIVKGKTDELHNLLMQLYGEYAPKNIPTRKRSAMEIGGGGSSSLDSGMEQENH